MAFEVVLEGLSFITSLNVPYTASTRGRAGTSTCSSANLPVFSKLFQYKIWMSGLRRRACSPNQGDIYSRKTRILHNKTSFEGFQGRTSVIPDGPQTSGENHLAILRKC